MQERIRMVSFKTTVQSSNEMGGSSQQEQTLEFKDENSGEMLDMSHAPMRYEIQDSVTEADLNQFLSRPVLIDEHTYNGADVAGYNYSINPWHAYFNTTAIKKKLDNYGFLRCNLHLKFVVNATPFVYGSIRACYRPLQNFTPERFAPDLVEKGELIPYSQYPGVWITPADCAGGEMVLPFFYQRNFIRANVAQDFIDLGELNYVNYTNMQSANGDASFSFVVQTYAWASNIVLSAPTLELALQGKDEYGDGPVSRPASTIAKYAGYLTKVPIIGPFAKATEIGASAISGIAKLFGWTNVPVISPTLPYRNTPFPQLASSEIGYPVEKLTLDAKNELTVDPQSLGLPPDDELSIQNIVGKQSFLTTQTWSSSHLVGRPLFTARVSPFMARAQVATATTGKIWFTPIGMVSTLFDNWRGDIIFTFKVICSQYHKGRLRISFDPSGSDIKTDTNDESLAFSTILDLGESTEAEVRIPYQQALSWLLCNGDLRSNNFTTGSSPTINRDDTLDNGMISVKVLTTLSAPVGTAAVNLLVFVKGAENLEFANPIDPSNGGIMTPFTIQGVNEYSHVDAESSSVGKTTNEVLIERNIVNFGESIASLRPLLRRSNLIDIRQLDQNIGTTSWETFRLVQTKYPPYLGYDPDGIFLAQKTLTAGSAKYNYSNDTPWHIITQCFIAQRGSTHWHYNVNLDGGDNLHSDNLTVTRFQDGGTTASFTFFTEPIGNDNAAARYFVRRLGNTAAGCAVTNQSTQSGLSFACPNYSPFKFQSTRPENATKPSTTYNLRDGSNREMFHIYGTCPSSLVPNQSRIFRYFGVGTDYSLYFFICAPVLNTMTDFPLSA